MGDHAGLTRLAPGRLGRAGLLMALAIVVAGCLDEEPAPTIPLLPVVSRTHLPPDADAAITACMVNWDKIAGIGRVPHARDAWKYVPLTGREPELQTDAPAWLIQIRGPYTAPLMPGTEVDPTCVVIAGVEIIFGTGGFWDDRGVFHPAPDVIVPPGHLPPLGP